MIENRKQYSKLQSGGIISGGAFKYSKYVKDANGNDKKISFLKGANSFFENGEPHELFGHYHFSSRCLRGGCTGWGDTINPAFPIFNVSFLMLYN